jgi:hypothetical protein
MVSLIGGQSAELLMLISLHVVASQPTAGAFVCRREKSLNAWKNENLLFHVSSHLLGCTCFNLQVLTACRPVRCWNWGLMCSK